MEVAHCLSILKETINHVNHYASVAEDTGTDQRTGMHVLTRTLNKLNLMMEVADYQIAACLLGLPTEITSESFTYMNVISHFNFMEHDKKSKKIEDEIININNLEENNSDDETLDSSEDASMYREEDDEENEKSSEKNTIQIEFEKKMVLYL